jgi:phage portal protein BeeE
MAAWAKAEDVDAGGTGTQLVSPYSQSAWVYTAVSILAQNVAMIPFRISRMDSAKARRVRGLRGSHQPEHRSFVRRALNANILESGPAVDLFNQPHPTMNRKLFWEMVVTWQALRGEFFILPLDGADQAVDLSDRNPRVSRMLTLPTELFWHIVQGYDLVAWRYTGSPLLTPVPSEILLPTEVIHSRSPNPYLYWRGMSPLILALLPAKTDYAGEQYQKGLWINNADTGVIVSTEQVLNEDQRKAIEVALRERKRKAGTADRPLFLFGGAKVEKPMLSMMDMQFLETRKFLRSEIFSIFKVPEPLAGFTENLNDGGAGGSLNAVKGSFIESTVGSLCTDLEAAVDPIVKSFGDDLVGWFDIDSLPIMQAQRRARWDTAGKMFAIGVPLNDINANLDLALPDYSWGKIGYLPFSVQPAGQPPEPLPTEDNADEGDPNPDGDDATKSNPFLRLQKLLSTAGQSYRSAQSEKAAADAAALWKRLIRMRQSSVSLVKGKIGKVLMVYRKKTLAKLDEVHLEKSAGRLGEIKSLVDIIFSANEFGAALNRELAAPISSILQSAGEEQLKELGMTDPWKYPPQGVLDFLASRQQPIMGVGGTVRDQLNTSLQEGIANGETHLELVGRVKDVFGNLADSEAKRVAQTEVNVAYNTARHQAQADAGIQYKAWLHTYSGHPRETHMIAGETYTREEPIPMDQPFMVDGEPLMFPCDPSGSPGNVINCHCINLAVIKTGEDDQVTSYKIVGLGEFKFQKHENH